VNACQRPLAGPLAFGASATGDAQNLRARKSD
jgi:hypothetical protein